MTMIKRSLPSMLRPTSMLQYFVLTTKTQGNALALVRSFEVFLYAAGLERKFRIWWNVLLCVCSCQPYSWVPMVWFLSFSWPIHRMPSKAYWLAFWLPARYRLRTPLVRLSAAFHKIWRYPWIEEVFVHPRVLTANSRNFSACIVYYLAMSSM